MNAEARVRAVLSKEFDDTFEEEVLQVGIALDKKPALKKFDAVARHKKIIAMVKDYSAKNLRGNQTRHARVMRDLYYLSLAQAEQRFMYLAAPFYEWLATQRDAAISPGIEVYKGKAVLYSMCNFVFDLCLPAGATESPKFREVMKLHPRWKIDPNYPTYPFPADSRKTILVKCLISGQ